MTTLRTTIFVLVLLVSGMAAAPADASTETTSTDAASVWTRSDAPNASAAPGGLSALDCVSSSECWALGTYQTGGGGTAVQMVHRDGATWQVGQTLEVPGQLGHQVDDVTCLSSTSCWAVGRSFTLSSAQPLVLRWDGHAWQAAPAPDVAGSGGLHGVTCTSDLDCWAVGYTMSSGTTHGLVVRWDGSQWQQHTASTLDDQATMLRGVTCTARECWTVGSQGTGSQARSLALRWTGTSWTETPVPAPLTDTLLSSSETALTEVTCVASGDCWAVGDAFDGTTHGPVLVHWNGASWSSNMPLDTPDTVEYALQDVSCSSTSDCWAVGRSRLQANVDLDRPVALHWNGVAWVPLAPTPEEDPAYGSDLAAIACVAASDCTAVGTVRPANSPRPLAHAWDGISWSEQAVPAVDSTTQSNLLRGVDCLAVDDCWAVGIYFSGPVSRSLSMHWDGTTWQIVASPDVRMDLNTYLKDIDCPATDDCWAVGSVTTTAGTAGQPLFLHWDGGSWSIESPTPVDTSVVEAHVLTSVTCVTSSDCWAVGHSKVNNSYHAVVHHWDGSSWLPVVAPHEGLPTESNALYAVDCFAAASCTAVGDHWDGTSYRTLTLRWDGSAWGVIDSPNATADHDNRLFGVACPADADCWAVGYANVPGDQTLLLRWDGSVWQVADPPAGDDFLYDVTCLSTTDCWGVGRPFGTPGTTPNASAAHWDGTAWTAVSVPQPSATSNLEAIACVSSGTCISVGKYQAGAGVFQGLMLRLAPPPPPVDTDGDGVVDDEDAFPLDPTEWVDTDADGTGDNADGDDDGDGRGDADDAFPTDPTEWGDRDGDGVGDNGDNCERAVNAGQQDLDGDGVGDVCDGDRDGDGHPNQQEVARGSDPDDPTSRPSP